MSLETNVQLLNDIVNVLELFNYEQKDAIKKHKALLETIVVNIESASRRTNDVLHAANELKSAKRHVGKRIDHSLLLPIDYYMTLFEEAVDSVIVTFGSQNHDEQVRHSVEAMLRKYLNQMEYLIIGGITRVDITNNEVAFTYSLVLSGTY